MAVFLQPIYTQTASGSTGTITFNNIPQTFTDLKLLISPRGTTTGPFDLFMRFNGDTGSSTLYSTTRLYGSGSSVASDRPYGASYNALVLPTFPGTEATSNTNGNTELYIPNYIGANFKQVLIDGVSENNATTAYQHLGAGLYRSTSAISSLSIFYGSNFTNTSTFSLYGILRSGV